METDLKDLLRTLSKLKDKNEKIIRLNNDTVLVKVENWKDVKIGNRGLF